MSRLPDQFHEDRALRDAARTVLFADLEHVRVTLSGKGVASRVAGRIGDGAKDVIEVAKGQADDKRGIIAALVAALFLWLARGPILEILGFGPEAEDTESDVSKAADTDDLRDDWPDHQEAPFAGDALSDLETELDDTAGDIPKTPPPEKTMTNTNSSTTTATDQRDELRAKIEASERRIAERTIADDAREAASAATEYVRQNPLTVVGGAIALGLVIGMMTKPGRRAAKGAVSGTANAVGGAASGAAKTVGTAAKKRGSAFATLLSDALVAYGIKLIDDALDGARAGQDKLEDIGDAASAKVRKASRDAEYLAGSGVDKARSATVRTRRRATRAVRDIANRVSS